MLTMVVKTAMTRMLAQRGNAPPLSAVTNCAPTITFTADQPMQAATLNSAIMMAPTQPNEKREIVIWRSPSFGPSVEKKATGDTPNALKRMIAAKLSQNPILRKGAEGSVPRATVEMTRLAESHMVKLSKIRT